MPRINDPRSDAMSGVQAKARLNLAAASQGGLRAPVTSATRGILLNYTSATGEIQLGAEIVTSDDRPLTPGDSHDVTLKFWADEASSVVRPGASFIAWHGRDIGSGAIISMSPRP